MVKKKFEYVLNGGKMSIGALKDFLAASYSNEPPYNIKGYVLDTSLSNEYVKVYYNPRTKRAIVAHRGSSTKADAWTDVKMTFGFKGNERHAISKAIQHKANAKYGPQNVSIVGHSLGATLAQDNLMPFNKEAILVSKPVLPGDVLTGRRKPKNQFEIRSQYDPTSMIKGLEKDTSDIVVPAETYNPLTEHGFRQVLSRLPNNKMVGYGRIGDINKMNVKEIKDYIKRLRPNIREYKITGLRRAQLVALYNKLNADINRPEEERIIDLYKYNYKSIENLKRNNRKISNEINKINDRIETLRSQLENCDCNDQEKIKALYNDLYENLNKQLDIVYRTMQLTYDDTMLQMADNKESIEYDLRYLMNRINEVDNIYENKINDVINRNMSRFDKIDRILGK